MITKFTFAHPTEVAAKLNEIKAGMNQTFELDENNGLGADDVWLEKEPGKDNLYKVVVSDRVKNEMRLLMIRMLQSSLEKRLNETS